MSDIKSIYKYTSINDKSLFNLEHNMLYAQSPIMFNDPYEFIFQLEVPDEQMNNFLQLIYGENYLKFYESKLSKKEILAHTREYYFGEHRKALGASCFTEDSRTELFWAHYGDNHRGMCLEFDRSLYPFKKSMKVEYVNKVPVITYHDLLSTDESLSSLFTKLCLTKSDVWSYEKEWRIISDANSYIPYELDCLLSITFGFFCPKEQKQRVMDKTAHLSINYFEIVRSMDSFTIERKLIY